MGQTVANEVITLMTKKRIAVVDANILIMGLTFKENCPDLRNARVVDIVHALNEYHCNVDVYDPWVDGMEFKIEYEINPIEKLGKGNYDAIVVAVAHQQFKDIPTKDFRSLGKNEHILYHIKYLLPAEMTDGRL